MCIVCADTGFTEDFLGMNAPSRCAYCRPKPFRGNVSFDITKKKNEQLEKKLEYLRSLNRERHG